MSQVWSHCELMTKGVGHRKIVGWGVCAALLWGVSTYSWAGSCFICVLVVTHPSPWRNETQLIPNRLKTGTRMGLYIKTRPLADPLLQKETLERNESKMWQTSWPHDSNHFTSFRCFSWFLSHRNTCANWMMCNFKGSSTVKVKLPAHCCEQGGCLAHLLKRIQFQDLFNKLENG